MPKYFAEKVFGHWLYFTSHCILEAMHVHASRDSRVREKGAAKFFVYADGSTQQASPPMKKLFPQLFRLFPN